MKNNFPRTCFLLAGSLFCASLAVASDTNAVAPVVTGPAVAVPEAAAEAAPVASPAPAPTAPVNLPYGVDDILKLSQAQVHDDVILNYIQSVPTVYNLGPKEIVYLRNEGVSDTVINSMLDQRKKALQTPSVPVMAEAVAPQVADASGVVPPPVMPVPMLVPTPVALYPDPLMASAFPICSPLCVPYDDPTASTLYVIPDHSVRAAYHGGGLRPYYGAYRGGYRSSVVVIGRGGGMRTYHNIGGHRGFRR